MNVNKEDMLVYAVTDRTWLGGRKLQDVVEEAILAGATFIQLREKELSADAFLEQAIAVKKVTDKYHIPFVINDNVEIALACDADGVHIGQHDMSPEEVRAKLGDHKILGISAQTVEQALSAEKSGADYLGVGAMFSTSTKLDASEVSFETLQKICKTVSIPIVAIGGIKQNNLEQLKDSGIDGVAVVSAIFASKSISGSTKELAKKMKEVLKK